MDDELLERVREIAEVPTAGETPGCAVDFLLDDLILTARKIILRDQPEQPPAVKKICGNPHCGCATRLHR